MLKFDFIKLDCMKSQNDVEQCVVVNNRYYPCPPPEKDLHKYKNLFIERSQQFSVILIEFGYSLSQSIQSFDFGKILTYEILNFNDEYEDHVRKFWATLPESEIAEPYKSFRKDFRNLQRQIPLRSSKFNNFKNALKDATCQKEILNLSETLDNLISLRTKLKKQFKGTDEEFVAIDTSMRKLFENFPQQVQEECHDTEKHQFHVENKIKVLDLLDLQC